MRGLQVWSEGKKRRVGAALKGLPWVEPFNPVTVARQGWKARKGGGGGGGGGGGS